MTDAARVRRTDAMPGALPLPQHRCPRCGGPNRCAAAASGSFATPCWCGDVVIDAATLALLPPQSRNRSCLCAGCAAGGRPTGD